MTKIRAQVIADSKNEFGNRITTMVVTFPRIILAEFNTHRMFSRNSASSRAIAFEKMVKSVEENPFIPIAWQKHHKGMQGNEYFPEVDKSFLETEWLIARDYAIQRAIRLNESGVTKQLCNRLLEPFMWHTVIVTATEWENFFALRCPQYVSGYKLGSPEERDKEFFRSWKDLCKKIPANKDTSILEKLQVNSGQSEIHMMALAESMWDAYNESTPKELKAGEWHVPFGDNIDFDLLASNYGEAVAYDLMIKIATARCARVSYTVVGEEGKPDNYENDIKLHDRLLASGHLSPFEHCTKAMDRHEFYHNVQGYFERHTSELDVLNSKVNYGWSNNFRGFVQYRQMIEKAK